jgi:multiple sugar transport system ATP-binding protein
VKDISFKEVTKTFPNGMRAVDGVSIDVPGGEFLVLVGPSGCGKTTLLRMLAGLEEVSDGQILIGERDVTYLEPRDRDIAMVFQNYALYPHMTVRQNLGYGLRVRRTPKEEIARRVEEVARLLVLEDLLDRRPALLSGGQRQRVAMGRAMVREPSAFLMDEPLSNLDAKLRVSMRVELARLHQLRNVTTIYVTHDQVEAMTLGDRVAVMRDGEVLQIDRPQVLYEHPANLFVAAFIGAPAMNLVEARFEGDSVNFGGFSIPLGRNQRPTSRGRDGHVILGIRPESFEHVDYASGDLPQLEVEVEVLEELGSDLHVFFSLDAPRLDTAELRSANEGEEDTLVRRERAVFNARIDPRARVGVGERTRLVVDPDRFRFFDPTTGTLLSTAQPSHLEVS